MEIVVSVLDFEKWLNQCNSVSRGTFSKTADSITLTSTSSDCYTDTYDGNGLKISVSAGKQYELSWDSSGDGTQRIIVFSGESNVIAESTTSPITFTIPSGYSYIKFRFGIKESGKTITFSNAQITTIVDMYFKQKPESYPVLENELSVLEVPSIPIPYKVFRQNENINDGYPYIKDSNECLSVLKSPFPKTVFRQNENINDGYPYIEDSNEYLAVLKYPFPQTIFIQSKNEYPKFYHLKPIDTGAFCYASNLETVKIPKSVKYIGETAFRHTALTEVTIAADCKYYPTSFPEDCKVNFYEETASTT